MEKKLQIRLLPGTIALLGIHFCFLSLRLGFNAHWGNLSVLIHCSKLKSFETKIYQPQGFTICNICIYHITVTGLFFSSKCLFPVIDSLRVCLRHKNVIYLSLNPLFKGCFSYSNLEALWLRNVITLFRL